MSRIDTTAFLAQLRSAWSRATSSKWTPANPACGQCSVTALVFQERFGGEILKTYVEGAAHFYNRVDGQRVDLTASQFAALPVYMDLPSSREEALADTTPRQYARLAAAMSK
jgi:hypothetical protein